MNLTYTHFKLSEHIEDLFELVFTALFFLSLLFIYLGITAVMNEKYMGQCLIPTMRL